MKPISPKDELCSLSPLHIDYPNILDDVCGFKGDKEITRCTVPKNVYILG